MSMTSDRIGMNRTNGLLRLAGAVVLLLTGIWFVIATIGVIAGVLYFIIDVPWQIITNKSGFRTTSRFGSALWKIFWWPWHQARWVFIGTGQFPWTPWHEGNFM